MNDRPLTGDEQTVRPTMAMACCMRRLRLTGGYLVRTRGMGWKVETEAGGPLYWFAPTTVNGLKNRGWVDDDGRLTRQGIAAMERYRT